MKIERCETISFSSLDMKTRLIYLFAISVGILVLLRFIYQSGASEGFADSGADIFTMYYADWCPHCQSIKPAFQEWAKNGFVSIAGRNVKVEMVQPEKEPEKMKAGVEVKGYPSFILFTADGKNVEYKGDRSVPGFMKFLEESLPNKAIAQQ